MLSGHQRITWRRNIAENFNRLSRMHERYRQTTDRQTTDRQTTDRRQTDGRRHIANMNMSSRSLKTRGYMPCILVNYQLVTVTICILLFTALHVMQTRSSDENSVCPSVCPSVTRVYCDKTVERSVQIYIPYER